jgi:UDP:flavonoid glycosyltransferase YjiC (YdhE family)
MGVPVLCCPAVGDMAENGARVGWAGCGLALPWRLLGNSSLRTVVKRMLDDGSFAARARQIAAWSAEHEGAEAGADLVEEYAHATERR